MIYVVGSTCGKFIKVGFAKTEEDMRSRLQSHSIDGLRGILFRTVICYAQGSRSNETEIKRLFKPYVINGTGVEETEIFHAVPEVVGWAVWLRLEWHTRHDQLGVQTPDAEDFEKWKPNSDRVENTTREAETLFDADVHGVWHWLPENQRFPHQTFVAPVNYIEAVRAAFDGEIDLDPASDAFAQRYIKAKRYFNESMNGLRLEWRGKVWLNPPFDDCDAWLQHAMCELQAQHVDELIVLVDFDKINSKYFQKFLPSVAVMYLIAGKVAWTDKPKDKDAESVPRHGYIFLYYGRRADHFRRTVAKHVNGTPWQTYLEQGVLTHV